MDQARIDQLIDSYLNGTATVEEREELLQWYRESHNKRVEWISDDAFEEEQVKARMLNAILAKTESKHKPAGRRKQWVAYSTAAAVLLLVTVGVWYFNKDARPHSSITHTKTVPQKEIVPAQNKARLTLADGS